MKRVMVAEPDACEYRQRDIRRTIAVAGQESHLFTAGIQDGVLLITHRTEGLELVARVFSAASPRPPDLIRHVRTK